MVDASSVPQTGIIRPQDGAQTLKRSSIYLRISLDHTGEGLAVERQRADCERIARERGWKIVATYTDNSISASDKANVRPDYDRMVRDYSNGRFDAVICWDLDRLTRQPRQLEDWIDAATEPGLLLVTANGEADLSTDGGRLFARIKASVARAEVERARQSAAQRQRAAMGRPPRGVRPTWVARGSNCISASSSRTPLRRSSG
ncbi:recombinase family protein [Nonomuraea lactucae]|uniref:recombinase family protein n=1 Tax=Nonomuraea lactucae TaxID=2249762 RepID=UPI0023DD5F93|nr:recombinase family protein [Nonomuraea lactucae]